MYPQITLEPVSKEQLFSSLFGGLETKKTCHNLYNKKLQNIDGSYNVNLSVLDKDKIWSYIPKTNDTSFSIYR